MNCETFRCSYCKKSDLIANFKKNHHYCTLMSALRKQTFQQQSLDPATPPSSPAVISRKGRTVATTPKNVTAHIENPKRVSSLIACRHLLPSLIACRICGHFISPQALGIRKHSTKRVLAAHSEMTEIQVTQLFAMIVTTTKENICVCVDSIVESFFEGVSPGAHLPFMQMIDLLCKYQRPFAVHFEPRIAGISKTAYFHSSCNNRAHIEIIISSWLVRDIFEMSVLTEICNFIGHMNAMCSSNVRSNHGQIGLNRFRISSMQCKRKKVEQVAHTKQESLPVLKKQKLCVNVRKEQTRDIASGEDNGDEDDTKTK